MESVRSFIALELPPSARAALAGVQQRLRATASRRGLPIEGCLKWVEPEGIHLTLVFLGNVDADLIATLAEFIDTAGAGQRAPWLSLTSLGAFPNPRQPRVLWSGLAGDVEQVGELQRRVQDSLTPLGFVPERRPFFPHLTLARVRERATPAERKVVADLLAAGATVPEVRFAAEHLRLMKSTLRPTGARYEALHTFSLPT